MEITYVIIISIILQFTASYFAIRLFYITGRRIAWILVAMGICLMAFRRCITLYGAINKNHFYPTDLSAELVALVTSALILIGVALIAPIFLSIKKSEESLRESEEWLSTTLISIGDAVIATDIKGLVKFMNPVAQALTGWKEKDAIGKPLEDIINIINSKTGEQVENPVSRVIKEGTVVRVPRYTILITKDGIKVPIDDSVAPIRDERKNISGAVLVFQDITKQKKAEKKIEEYLSLLQATLDSTADGIFVTDRQGNIVTFNERFINMIQIPKHIIDSRNAMETLQFATNLFRNPEETVKKISGLLDKPESKGYAITELKNGRIFERYSQPQQISGKIVGRVWSVRDVTERKKAEDKIKASLAEKEALLKEIHHRVKNNLQVISSLLNLQFVDNLKDRSAMDIFRESQNCIKSMALIHEKLYQSKDLTRIDFGEYIGNLTANLFSSYKVNSDAIILKINVNNILFGIDMAIPCALIINELVSNSLKYAFSAFGVHADRPKNGILNDQSKLKGEICVDLHLDDKNRYILIVRDNGVGFPEDIDFRNTKSLGMQLVVTLTHQIGGTISLDRKDGTAFKIVFEEQKIGNVR
ncbi:MAG: histidine kinase dimerization/phosphoacceptor domain -containing protein, partial [Thermodesulfobacteriota bacterium]|nr:histidine kinase dimerization/phosphoacceptor domain -containing protein [Thermodesulfobacteriota bacterium]